MIACDAKNDGPYGDSEVSAFQVSRANVLVSALVLTDQRKMRAAIYYFHAPVKGDSLRVDPVHHHGHVKVHLS